jgi:hypothetical protein
MGGGAYNNIILNPDFSGNHGSSETSKTSKDPLMRVRVSLDPLTFDEVFKAVTIAYDERVFSLKHQRCSICLCDFEPGDSLAPMLCDLRHTIHSECLVRWLRTKSRCPMCKGMVNLEQLVKGKALYEHISKGKRRGNLIS